MPILLALTAATEIACPALPGQVWRYVDSYHVVLEIISFSAVNIVLIKPFRKQGALEDLTNWLSELLDKLLFFVRAGPNMGEDKQDALMR